MFAYTYRSVDSFVGKRGLQASGNGLLTNLQAYWAMDDASWGTRNSSVSGSNTLSDSVGSISAISGKINNSAYYDNAFGGNWNALFNGSPTVTLTGDWSITGWININSVHVGDAQGIMSFQNALGIGPFVWMDTDGAIILDSSMDAASITYPDYNTWFHFAMTFNYSLFEFTTYINSGFLDAKNASSNLIPCTEITMFNNPYSGHGYPYPDDQPFNGSIDEVGFWNRCLTQSDVNALYNNGNGKSFSTFTS